MNKRHNKPFDRNKRLDEPCGLLGVPPPNCTTVKIYVPCSAVVIITDKPVYKRRKYLPQ